MAVRSATENKNFTVVVFSQIVVKREGIPQIKKGNNLKYFTVQNPIAVRVEGKQKKPRHSLSWLWFHYQYYTTKETESEQG